MRKTQNETRRTRSENEYTGPLFTVNWKWLFGTVAVVTVLTLVFGVVYYLQTRNQTEFRIQIFRNAEEAGQWRNGIVQLLAYHQEKSNDVAIVREIAEAFDRNGVVRSDWRTASEYYRKLLAHLSPADALWLTTLEKILDNQRKASDTEGMYPTIQQILKASPESPLAWKCLVIVRVPMINTGIYQAGQGEPQFFDQLIKKAMELNPEDTDLVVVYARLLRSTSSNTLNCMSPEFRDKPFPIRAEEADSLMANFTKNHPDSPGALMAGYEYRWKNQLLDPGATTLDETLVRVQELEPNNPALMMYTGLFYEQKALRLKFGPSSYDEYQNQRQEAIDQFEQMIKTTPRNPAGYLQLAAIYALDGERDKQIAILERANKSMNSSELAVIIPLVSAYLDNNDSKNADRTIPLIHHWLDRNRTLGKDVKTSILQIATLLEGQSLALAGHPVEAISRFKSVFEPVIPNKVDIRTLHTSMMIYAQQLTKTLNPDSAVTVYEQILRHLESDIFSNDTMNAVRIDRTYLSLIGALLQLGQMDRMAVMIDRYVAFLRKSLEQNPDNQMIRLALSSVLFQQTMNQPVEQRNWSELHLMLETLQSNAASVIPPWRTDFLRASVRWEEMGRSRANVEEVLIPLRVVENRYKNDLLFLVNLEAAYHKYNASRDCDRVLETIREFPNGLPFWYLIKATRAEQLGDAREARRLLNEALTKLPENLKEHFLTLQETLDQASDRNEKSIVIERQTLERLRDMNEKEPTIATLFQQGLMELDLGNTATVAQLEIKLKKLEDKDATLSLLLEGYRFLMDAVDAQDPKFDKARLCQEKLLRTRPNWEFTYLLAADIADKAGTERAVIDALVKAIDAGNRDPFRYRDLIDLYLRSNQEDRAKTTAERGIRMFPNFPVVFHVRFDHPYQSIFKDFTRAIRRGDVVTARKFGEQWLVLAEKNHVEEKQMAVFYTIIAQNFFDIDRLNEAEHYFVLAAKSGGETVVPLAKYYAHTGKLQEAMQMLHKEMTQSPTPEVFLWPALTLMRDYECDPAWVEPFDAFVLEFQPSSTNEPGKLYQYIDYWVIRQKNDLALPFYRRLYELFPNNTLVLNDLGYMIAFQQTDDDSTREANIKEGLNLLNKAITLEEHNANLIDTKGLIVMLQGHPDEAVPLFEKAVELSNHAILYHLHLAVALLRDQQKDRAETEFAVIRAMLVPQMDLLPESNRNYTRELLGAFPE